MLDPDVVLAAVVEAISSIPEVVTEMGGANMIAQTITGHYFAVGEENSLSKALGEMTSPSMLIAYLDLLGGNFAGDTVFKHRLQVFWKPRSRAQGSYEGDPPATAQHFWWLMMNRPVLNGAAPSLRYIELCGGNLQLMDTPTMQHKTDELGQDFFVGTMVFPEKGDTDLFS